MAGKELTRLKTIGEFHKLKGLAKPLHPLVSIIDMADVECINKIDETKWVYDFYHISISRDLNARIKYGQQQYDYDDGVMFFVSPNQVFEIEPLPTPSEKLSGWMLLFHPDFIWNTPLAKTINQYEYFGYAVNEALVLSEKEEATLNSIIENIRQEYHANIDKFSQAIIISQIETLLNYSDRFYQRHFITQKKAHAQIIDRLEQLLDEYFNNDDLISKGLPTVQYIAETLNLSPSYLSSLLKVLTGQSTQHHIHEKLIEKAKEKLSTSSLTVSEIAYELGFEHSQSFSKLFKTKTELTPLAFRQSFN